MSAQNAAVDPPDADDAGTISGYLLLFSCVVIWGISTVAFRVAVRPPGGGLGMDPVFFHGLRFLVVAPCLALIAAVRRPEALRLAPGDIKQYVLFGFLAIGLGETLPTFALRYTSVTNLTLLTHGTLSLFTAIWAWLLLRQPIGRTGWIGALIAFMGVALVASKGGRHFEFGGGAWQGDVIAITRSIIHSAYLLTLSRWLRQRSVLQVTVYNCVFGALWLLPYVLWRARTFDWAAVPASVWWALLWAILPTTLYAFLVWNWGLRRVGAVAATNLFYLMPLSAAVAAWVILGEKIVAAQIVGGLVILVGVMLLRWDTLRLVVGPALNRPEINLRAKFKRPFGRGKRRRERDGHE